MKHRIVLAAMLMGASMFMAEAQDPWLHVYYPKGQSYKQFPMESVLDVVFDDETGSMTINTEADGEETVRLSAIDRFVVGANVCRIDIDTDLKVYDETYPFESSIYEKQYLGTPVTDVISKEVYLDGTLRFDGRGIYDDLEVRVKVRGRGNNTWGRSKKPYRLKFEEKQKLGPIHKAKNQVLLANYLDGSMMRNFVAFKFGEVIGMPYINRSLPVDVYFNGDYKGSYHLTEKVGINNGSVDLAKEDEPNSILFELDTNSATEDEYPAVDEIFNIPYVIKDPDAPEDYNEREAWLDYWRNDLYDFFTIVSDEDPQEIFAACDLESLVRYVMVYDICCNQELNHPKSVYLHKTKGGLYEFGPCWDFDWAFGYEPTYQKGKSGTSWWDPDYRESPSYENPLIGFGSSANQGGNILFYSLLNNTVFLNRFKEVWTDFYKNKQPEFWAAFDEYAKTLEPSANLQGLTRSQYSNWTGLVENLRQWVQNRIEFINSDPNYGLWE